MVRAYGEEFHQELYRRSKSVARAILPQVPDIGNSVFKTNYYYCVCYCGWFGAMQAMGLSADEAVKVIWFINEAYLKSFPRGLMKLGGRFYAHTRRKRGPKAAARSLSGNVHPMDWKIRYEQVDSTTWKIDILECFMVKLAQKLGIKDMLPGICRMDYPFSHYFDTEFRRKGTLADGFPWCDCWYRYPGRCDWPVAMDIEGNRE